MLLSMSGDDPRSVVPDATAAERALIERVRAGDSLAFREFFVAFAPRVRRFARNLVDTDAAADEVTQESFVRAHRAITGGAEVLRAAPWLLGVVRNVVREQHRARRNVIALDRTDAEERACPAPDPEALLIGRETDEALSRALDTLSEERRVALVLRVDQALPYEDIAAILHWNIARVKNEIHRARMQLRAALSARLERPEVAR